MMTTTFTAEHIRYTFGPDTAISWVKCVQNSKYAIVLPESER